MFLVHYNYGRRQHISNKRGTSCDRSTTFQPPHFNGLYCRQFRYLGDQLLTHVHQSEDFYVLVVAHVASKTHCGKADFL